MKNTVDLSNLKKGLEEEPKYLITKTFALYSDEYKHGIDHLNLPSTIQEIYQREVMKIRQSYSYMGIWQIFALSSILKNKIYSVYPKRGNRNVRKDLHRIVHPRLSVGKDNLVYVMWTSTKSDMRNGHGVPNHFVPALPVDGNCTNTERKLKDEPNETKHDKLLHDHLERWRLLRTQKLEKERKGLHESNDKQTNSDENINKEELEAHLSEPVSLT